MFPPTVQEGPLFSISSPTFVVCRFFDDGHSNQCEVIIPYCSFDLHFSNRVMLSTFSCVFLVGCISSLEYSSLFQLSVL